VDGQIGYPPGRALACAGIGAPSCDPRLAEGTLALALARSHCAPWHSACLDHPLTTSEFNLLKAFVDHPRRVLSRERLLDLANARDPDAFDRAIDVRITRIRRKVEPDPNHPRIIRTIRGAGYVFSPDGQDQ
jgi:DNA-binding response OmpR family regulator